jgi:hypothetical protein
VDKNLVIFGDDPRWHRFTPSVWQAIASDLIEDLPSIAERTSFKDPFNESGDHRDISPVQAFSTALQVARYGLGWSEGARGFAKWSTFGFDVANPHLRVISHLLGDHVQYLANWLSGEPSGSSNPLTSGGYDSYHLEGHSRGPDLEFNQMKLKTFSTRGPDSIVLITDSYLGWYKLLRNQSAHQDNKLLSVDVYCQPVGWLGEFNRSPTTGLWHCTTEDVHLWDKQ